jgi:DNA (cytosine-5)-methyltransferase 1
MTEALYNEIEPYAADWLVNLAARGHVAPGRVERRSITELTAADVAGPGQRHFFAGIGVWSRAMRLAGVPDGLSAWTGSCPCQPFSAAGRRAGFDDERHLWPAWFKLIRECTPPIIFGEQVASPDGLAWLDVVLADLEAAGYACGAADLCAAGFGAPHLRQRLYFVAVAGPERCQGLDAYLRQRRQNQDRTETARRAAPGRDGSSTPGASLVGDAGRARGRRHAGADDRAQGESAGEGTSARGVGNLSLSPGSARELVDADEGERGPGWAGEADGDGTIELAGSGDAGRTRGFWAECDWVPCRDGKARPVEPGAFPLAHGAPSRVGRLRAYGNAIVAPQAAEFVEAGLDAAAELLLG